MAYLIFIIIYLWQAFLVWQVALRMGEKMAWLAWIPFASDYLISRLARKHFGWWLLFYVPIVNLYVAYVFWSGIMRRYQKPFWLGLLMFLPLVNWLMLFLLVFIFRYPDAPVDEATEKMPPQDDGQIKL